MGLPAGECGERRRVGTQDSWPQPDRNNKWQFEQPVKLILGEAPFGACENRSMTTSKIGQGRRDRSYGTGFGA